MRKAPLVAMLLVAASVGAQDNAVRGFEISCRGEASLVAKYFSVNGAFVELGSVRVSPATQYSEARVTQQRDLLLFDWPGYALVVGDGAAALHDLSRLDGTVKRLICDAPKPAPGKPDA